MRLKELHKRLDREIEIIEFYSLARKFGFCYPNYINGLRI